MIEQLIRPRHAETMRALREAAKRVAKPDEKVIIMIYDGPTSIARELSYSAPGQLQNDVRLICEAVAAQIKQ